MLISQILNKNLLYSRFAIILIDYFHIIFVVSHSMLILFHFQAYYYYL